MTPEATAPRPSEAETPHAGDSENLAETSLAARTEAPEAPTPWPARLFELAGAAVVFALVLAVATGVVLRVAGHGVLGLVELGALAMLLIVVLGAGPLSQRDEHVRLGLLDSLAAPRVLRVLEVIGDAIQVAVSAVVAYALWRVFTSDLQTGTTVGGELDLARSWLSGASTAGFAVVGVVLLRKLARDLFPGGGR